ncbi:MAG: DNA repair protein RecO [Phycisphaerales bacterium]|nr:DNA repair protein RecO [Phycisphaerales bacterium]
MPTIKDEAVILRHWEFSETSQTAWTLTREHGLLRLLAKGSRRPNSPFSGGLDALTRGQIVAIIKPAAELATLTEWDLQEVFWAPRRSLAAHYAGLYMADVVSQLITDHDPHPRIYEALVLALRALDDPAPVAATALQLQWAALAEAGYAPSLDRDARSGGPLAPARTYAFDPSAGGLTEDPGSGQPGVWRVRAETVLRLRQLALGSPPQPPQDPAADERACRMLAAWIAAVAGAEPRSQAAFLGVIPPSSTPKKG